MKLVKFKEFAAHECAATILINRVVIVNIMFRVLRGELFTVKLAYVHYAAPVENIANGNKVKTYKIGWIL